MGHKWDVNGTLMGHTTMAQRRLVRVMQEFRNWQNHTLNCLWKTFAMKHIRKWAKISIFANLTCYYGKDCFSHSQQA